MNKAEQLIELMLKPNVQQFITAHEKDDAEELSLKFRGKVDFDIAVVSQQVALRQKANRKIKSFLKPATVLLPKLYEQSTHEEVAKYKASLIKGNTLLDATTGLGIDSFLISKNFKNVVCLEADRDHYFVLKHNFKLHDFNAEIVHTPIESFLTGDKRKFDIIYVDPDRRAGKGRELFDLKLFSPDVLELKSILLERAKEVWIKLSPMVDLSLIVNSFSPNVAKVICIAQMNEMKEILVCLKKEEQTVSFTATNIAPGQTHSFTSGSTHRNLIQSQPLKYFFEPNVALIKSRLGWEYAFKNNLRPLFPNGFYFTTDEYKDDLQGRLFQMENVMAYKKESLNDFIRENKITQANISCRNFFWKPEDVKKQLKLKDGGDWYLFCYNNAEKKPVAVWCKKVK